MKRMGESIDARRYRRMGPWLAIASGVLLLAMAWSYRYYYPRRIGPEQPIPFSHRVHAGDKQISCLVCHEGATRSAQAGIPPLETCMLCHERIAVAYPPIADLRRHYAEKTPVAWVRVNDVPDFVFFNHEAHLRQGVDCGQCHGDVRDMDRLSVYQELNMGFCVQCHRDHHVSHDCMMCHR